MPIRFWQKMPNEDVRIDEAIKAKTMIGERQTRAENENIKSKKRLKRKYMLKVIFQEFEGRCSNIRNG